MQGAPRAGSHQCPQYMTNRYIIKVYYLNTVSLSIRNRLIRAWTWTWTKVDNDYIINNYIDKLFSCYHTCKGVVPEGKVKLTLESAAINDRWWLAWPSSTTTPSIIVRYFSESVAFGNHICRIKWNLLQWCQFTNFLGGGKIFYGVGEIFCAIRLKAKPRISTPYRSEFMY